MTYTVIGLHDDTGEVYAAHIEADDPHAAMRAVANGDEPPSQILCAIEGAHAATAPCEDSGKAAYIEDLADDKEDS